MDSAFAHETCEPITLHGCVKTAFLSQINGRAYQISVARPYETPGPRGFGVLYVLDGYAYFASAADAVRANLNAPGVVVVGVGYPETPGFIEPALAKRAERNMLLPETPDYLAACAFERFRDLALPAGAQTLARESIPGLFQLRPGDVGGLDDFLEVIETEIKPRVRTLLPLDPANEALFGHSLGGLAVLRALFRHPERYRTYVAASPAIWWADNAVLEDEAAFAARVADGAADPRILVTVGGREETPPTLPEGIALDQEALRSGIKRQRMIGNAQALVARLQAIRGKGRYHVEDCVVFEDQQHGVVPWPSLGRTISFAFGASAIP